MIFGFLAIILMGFTIITTVFLFGYKRTMASCFIPPYADMPARTWTKSSSNRPSVSTRKRKKVLLKDLDSYDQTDAVSTTDE